MDRKQIWDILENQVLPLVKKPGRYIGGEINSVIKDLSNVDVRFALAFPDVYEIYVDVASSNTNVIVVMDELFNSDDPWNPYDVNFVWETSVGADGLIGISQSNLVEGDPLSYQSNFYGMNHLDYYFIVSDNEGFTEDTETTYKYDKGNMLKEIIFDSGDCLRFWYDASGRRIKKWDSETGEMTLYIYSTGLEPLMVDTKYVSDLTCSSVGERDPIPKSRPISEVPNP